jgi:histidinol-phosphate aminotransferase
MNRREWIKTGAVAAGAAAVARPAAGAAPRAGAQPGVAFLAANENPYGPPAGALRAAQEAARSGNRYARPAAVSALKQAIARREGLTPEHVVLGAGSSEVLCAAAIAFCAGGGELVAPDPTFMVLPRYAERLGATVRMVGLTGRFEHDLDAMDAGVSRATRLVYLCNPNNPTGSVTATDRLRAFCDAVSRRAPVFVDEAYLEYLDDPAAASMAGFVREGRDVVVSRTFSKIFGLAGLRVGYALARPELAARLEQFRTSPPGPLGVAAALACAGDDAFVAASRRRNAEARAYAESAIAGLGLEVAPSRANFLWVRVGPANRGLPAALAARGVAITWDAAPLRGDWARVSVGTMDEMRRFAVALGPSLRA